MFYNLSDPSMFKCFPSNVCPNECSVLTGLIHMECKHLQGLTFTPTFFLLHASPLLLLQSLLRTISISISGTLCGSQGLHPTLPRMPNLACMWMLPLPSLLIHFPGC